MRHFYKEQPFANKINWSNGSSIAWEIVGDDLGVLATEDAQQISELDALIQQRRGGVASIQQDQFDSLKKNPKFKQQAAPSAIQSPYNLIDLGTNPIGPAAPAAVAARSQEVVVARPKESAPPVAAKVTPPKPVAPRTTRRAASSTKPLVAQTAG